MIPSSSPSSNKTPTGTDYHENYEQTMSEFIAPHTWIIIVTDVCALGLSPKSECVCVPCSSHKLLLVAKNIELKLKWRVNHSTQNWDRITYFCSNDFLFFSSAVFFLQNEFISSTILVGWDHIQRHKNWLFSRRVFFVFSCSRFERCHEVIRITQLEARLSLCLPRISRFHFSFLLSAFFMSASFSASHGESFKRKRDFLNAQT